MDTIRLRVKRSFEYHIFSLQTGIRMFEFFVLLLYRTRVLVELIDHNLRVNLTMLRREHVQIDRCDQLVRVAAETE